MDIQSLFEICISLLKEKYNDTNYLINYLSDLSLKSKNSNEVCKTIIQLFNKNSEYNLITEYDLYNIIKNVIENEKVFFNFIKHLNLDEIDTEYYSNIYLVIAKHDTLSKEEKIKYILKCIDYKLPFNIEILIWFVADSYYSVISYIFKENKNNSLMSEKDAELLIYLLIQDEKITYNEAYNIILSFYDLNCIPKMFKKYIYVLYNKYYNKNIFFDLLYNFIIVHQKNDFITISINYINSYIVYNALNFYYKIVNFFN